MAYDIEAVLHVLQSARERVTSDFGNRTIYIGGKYSTNFHSGIDLIDRVSGVDGICAAAAGTVCAVRDSIAGYSETYSSGNYVKLSHSGGYTTEYFHMKLGSVAVKLGQQVQKGQLLGQMGSTGWSTGNHLHFGVRIDGTAVDPKPYLLGQKSIEGGTVPSTPTAREGQMTLERVALYAASTSTAAAGTVTGVYYLWSLSPVNGRYRITNSESNIGRAGQVTGWIDASALPVSAPEATSSDPAAENGEPQNTPQQPTDPAVIEMQQELDRLRRVMESIRAALAQL